MRDDNRADGPYREFAEGPEWFADHETGNDSASRSSGSGEVNLIASWIPGGGGGDGLAATLSNDRRSSDARVKIGRSPSGTIGEEKDVLVGFLDYLR
jgi:hypothetical protein